MLYRIYNRIRTVLQWLPLIWEDRQWDWTYLLRVMQFKMRLMRRYHERWRRHSDVEYTIHRLRTCELLIERLLNDDYCTQDYAIYFQKYPSRWRGGGEPRVPNQEERRMFREIMDREVRMRQQDEEALFRLMRKHYRRWWD